MRSWTDHLSNVENIHPEDAEEKDGGRSSAVEALTPATSLTKN